MPVKSVCKPRSFEYREWSYTHESPDSEAFLFGYAIVDIGKNTITVAKHSFDGKLISISEQKNSNGFIEI